MLPGYNGTKEIIDINGSGGAQVSILARGPVRKVRIQESNLTSTGAANTTQGTNYYLPNDESANGFTEKFNLPAGSVLAIPDDSDQSYHGPLGAIIGNGPGVEIGIGATPATTLCNIISATATGTSVIVEQFY